MRFARPAIKLLIWDLEQADAVHKQASAWMRWPVCHSRHLLR
jgi:hypothetical protein